MDQVLRVTKAVLAAEQVKAGGGRHDYYLTTSQIIEAAKLQDIAEFLFIVSACLTKISICLFVMRIPNSKRMIRLLYFLVISTLLVGILCTVILIVQCEPLQKIWDSRIKGSCWNPVIPLAFTDLQSCKLLILLAQDKR